MTQPESLPLPPNPQGTGDDLSHSTNTQNNTKSFHQVSGTPLPSFILRQTADTSASSASSSTRFEIRKVLGSGGFGTVSLAWDLALEREVAIKRPATHLEDPLKQTFLAEARMAAKVKHPGIVAVYDVGLDEEGDPFVVYEFLAGATLKQWLTTHKLSLNDALQIAIQLADALAAAHQQGVTHRDLKPANILIDEQGRPRIVDFGLATEHDKQSGLRGQVAGTKRYMSPEQVRGEAHHLDGRTDLWSLGVILYEMLTKQTPFPGTDQDVVFEQILHREPRPPRQWLGSIPRSVEEIVLKLLAKPIAQRYSTASDVADELRKVARQLASEESPVATSAAKSTSRLVPNAITSGIGALLVIPLLLLAAWNFFGPGDQDGPNSDSPQVPGEKGPQFQPLPPVTSPFNDRDFTVGTWVDLLQREPAAILFAADDRRVWTPGELWIKASYPAILQLGETQAPSYSLRAQLQTEKWDSEVGLFFGYGPVAEPRDTDSMVIVGLVQTGDMIALKPRIVELQRSGQQYPQRIQDRGLHSTAIKLDMENAVLQVDVLEGKVGAMLLNRRPIEFADADLTKIRELPAKGKFGVYSFGRTVSVSSFEIRVISAVSK